MSAPQHTLPPAMGPYATTRRAAGFLFLSGQGGIDPETGKRGAFGIVDETRLTLENIQRLLRSERYEMADLVQVTCYLTDMEDWPALNTVYAEFMGPDTRPPRTAVGVASLPFGLTVEIAAVAYKD